MKKLFYFFWAVAFVFPVSLLAQKIDRVKFFEEESTIDATLEIDMKDLLGKKQKERFLPATFTMNMPDGSSITDKIEASVRGNFRRENCFMPGLKLKLNVDSNSRFSKLKELKLTNGCNTNEESGQLVIKEFLVYKIYNLLTDKSLRVRLLKLNFKDAAGKRKPYTQMAFFTEDIDEMAKRNKMIEIEGTSFGTEVTNREHMTLVTMFQYLIGNTDWSVPAYHNIKLIGLKDDNTARPYAVAYDFDICGLVDPPYATVSELLQNQITSVRERLNRGFPRTMEELKETIKSFNDKKTQILDLVNKNEYLSAKSKAATISYINDFYKIINDDREVKRVFIDGARGM
ncbi:MAG TPA: hypothetical protein VI548_06365 [Chitinophagaceae bacterium]|nr:hypothetical protein [Chitinophagaceae bacterium]